MRLLLVVFATLSLTACASTANWTAEDYNRFGNAMGDASRAVQPQPASQPAGGMCMVDNAGGGVYVHNCR